MHDDATLTERVPEFDRDGRAAYRVETTDDLDLTAAIVAAVSEISDCDPVGEGPTLYDAVDPDALDKLFADRHDGAPRTGGRVVFDVQGCRVEVHADGCHLVYGPERTPSTTTSPMGLP
ncbi:MULTISPECIES: HalOD1 output domain-containing protein [Halorussus]|uniref:HalOD1 output domain-containing protein n=1 Tax=Halorussus TaxID=1070314 RepID=UPI00209EA372|nr:HalOD1 output domain-containing protein [Halorussus vallis]USZ77846.1 hypothetical protein NGM07_21945 [Halorussus vallis]